MTENADPLSKLKLPFTRIASLSQLAVARMLPKPNKKHSVSLLLDKTELLGPDWYQSLQQSFPTGVVRNRNDPIYVRARESKSTTSRRMFKKMFDADDQSVMLQVAPFISDEDAAAVVTRYEKSSRELVSKIVTLNRFDVIEEIESTKLGPITCVEYEWDALGRTRVARGLAAHVGNVCMGVSWPKCGDAAPWSDVIDIAVMQAEKILSVIDQG